MSGGTACQCGEHKLAIKMRAWVITKYRCNYSAFNGYHWTPSAYSEIHCRSCRSSWRTTAQYVEQLKHGSVT